MTERSILLTGLLVAVLASGCTHWLQTQTAHDDAVEEVVRVWPPAPATPRIRYLHSITSERDIGVRPGAFKRFVRFLKGEETRELTRPQGLAIDDRNRLYVVDTLQRRVHVFDRDRGEHYVFPEKEPEGFIHPVGVAAGTHGHVYVSDSMANVIHVFSDYGRRYEGRIGDRLFERPTGLAFDPAGQRLLVTDTVAASLLAFNEAPPVADGKGGVGNLVPEPAAVWRGEGGDRLHAPTHVAIDRHGAIVVNDSLNFRMRLLDRNLAAVHAFGAAGKRPGYFSRPKGVAVDSEGHIYVVDALFGNVQIFNAQGDLLLSFGEPGTGPGEFWLPGDIFIDGEDRIHVADAWNQRVQVFQYLRPEAHP